MMQQGMYQRDLHKRERLRAAQRLTRACVRAGRAKGRDEKRRAERAVIAAMREKERVRRMQSEEARKRAVERAREQADMLARTRREDAREAWLWALPRAALLAAVAGLVAWWLL